MSLAAGLLAAAFCSGCFRVLMDALSASGLQTSPWRRVAASFGFAAAVFLVTSILMRQLLAISPHKSGGASQALGTDEAAPHQEEDDDDDH